MSFSVTNRMDRVDHNEVMVTGKCADYLGIVGRVRYDARLRAHAEGGSVHVDGTTLTIENADSATL